MLHRNDLNEVYQAVEQTLGPNTGVNNTVLFNVKAVIGTGTGRNLRQYYVPCQMPQNPAGSQFVCVVVNIVPKQAPYRHTAALLATAGVADYKTILTNIATAIGTAGDTSIPISPIANMVA